MIDRDRDQSKAGEAEGVEGFEESVPFERTVLMLVAALETGTIVMVTAVLSVVGVGWFTTLIVASASLAPIALLAAMRLRLRLTDRGLAWRWAPFAWGCVPYEVVESAEAIEVDPMRDFGGWGPKFSFRRPRSFGLIAKRGGAVRVRRTDGKRDLVVSTHEPERLAAALLERAIQREETAAPR